MKMLAGLLCVLTMAAAAQSQNSHFDPPDRQDGWATSGAATAGLDTARLQGLESAIAAGELKKIGSVLVARHGKLVYEAYFDGDAARGEIRLKLSPILNRLLRYELPSNAR